MTAKFSKANFPQESSAPSGCFLNNGMRQAVDTFRLTGVLTRLTGVRYGIRIK